MSAPRWVLGASCISTCAGQGMGLLGAALLNIQLVLPGSRKAFGVNC